MDEIPFVQKVMEQILDANSAVGERGGTVDSLLNKDENAVLKALAHFLSVNAWPGSFVSLVVQVD